MEKLNPIKNVELHKNIQCVFTVIYNENHPNQLDAFKDPTIFLINYIKDGGLVYIPLDCAISTTKMSEYQKYMYHCFKMILIFEKQITGIVKNDIMNIYYSREECLDYMGIDRFSVNKLNKITRSFMRKVYEFIRNNI